ncbi:SapC family protein [Paraglaciecola sp.]|uniref:SapC family protein n=1 Tax=Paraglaciecola sp. TaxID=1920173 RepID=UPI0030F40414
MANIQALDKNKHQHLKLVSEQLFTDIPKSHVVMVTVFELAKVAAEYPITFIKDQNTGQFHLVALLGLQPKENLFIKNAQWQGNYIPMHFKALPFVLSSHPNDSDKHVLCADLDSAQISEQNGVALFDEQGNQSELLTKKAEYVGQLMDQFSVTRNFISELINKELLSPQSLTIKPKEGEEYDLTGLYTINENSLNDLSTDAYEQLRKSGFIAPIYACLFSMSRIESLVRLKAEQ